MQRITASQKLPIGLQPLNKPVIKLESTGFQSVPARDTLAVEAPAGIPATQALLASPAHAGIQAALRQALKDGIDAREASELRGLLLDLKPAERQRYRPLLASLKMSDYARPMLLEIDPDPVEYLKSFSAEDFRLIDSLPFKRMFPNYAHLEMPLRIRVLAELKPFLARFPGLLEHMAEIPNANYGAGFQFFFLDEKLDQELGGIIPDGYAGQVMPGGHALKNPLLRFVAAPFAQARLFDKGGLFAYALFSGTFTHEMAHVVHLHSLRDDERDAVKNLYDQAWEKDRATGGKQGFITAYAKTNPYEYFAEGVEDYLVDQGTALRQKDPALYAFVAKLFQPGAVYAPGGSHLLNDPEQIGWQTSFRDGKTWYGVTLSRDSDVVSLKHFEGSIPTEVSLAARPGGVMVQGSLGLKAAWKPWTKPIGFYGTLGATALAGIENRDFFAAAGGYAGVGIDYKHFNLEARHNFLTGPDKTDIRAGVRFEF